MASCAAPSAVRSAFWTSTRPPRPGASSSTSPSLRLAQQPTWPSQVSARRPCVSAEYRQGGGGGGFVAGFFLGGLVFGGLGYVLALKITKSLEGAQNEDNEATPKKMTDIVDDGSLETTRRSLNERIAQLSAAIDDVSAQVKNVDTSDGIKELESPVGL